MKNIRSPIHENRLKVKNEVDKQSFVLTITLDHIKYINLRVLC